VQIYQGSTLAMNYLLLEIGSAGGATADALTVDAGHTLQGAGLVQETSSLSSSVLVNNGTVIADVAGQTLDFGPNVSLAGSGVYAIVAGATLRLENGEANDAFFEFGVGSGGTVETLQFAGPNGSVPPPPNNWEGTLRDFYGADRVDLPNVNFASQSPQVYYVPNPDPTTGGNVTVSYNLGSVIFVVTGSHPGGFQVHGDGGTGTALIASDAAPCFAAGTRIATPCGEVLVEALAIGDAVSLAGGGVAQVAWIGRRTVDAARHPEPRKVWPVRIMTNAFGPGLPVRDLWLSPDHAVFVDDVLIPVKHLINGTTIAQIPVDDVSYYHVELPAHDLLLAEGLAVESYLDTGDRSNFLNGGGPVALHPDFASRVWEAEGCAPLIVFGSKLEAIRQRVNARAPSTVGDAVATAA